jgi:Metal-dependent hydrolases of the beta-lactamase superfamily III
LNLQKTALVLIHESTFVKEDYMNAKEHFHSTSADAANIAKQSNSKELILTHISTRYTEEFNKIMLMEAKEVFENTKLAHDFMELKLR